MTLAERIQEIRSAAGPLLRDAPGDMTCYIMKIDGICHDVQELEHERDEAKAAAKHWKDCNRYRWEELAIVVSPTPTESPYEATRRVVAERDLLRAKLKEIEERWYASNRAIAEREKEIEARDRVVAAAQAAYDALAGLFVTHHPQEPMGSWVGELRDLGNALATDGE